MSFFRDKKFNLVDPVGARGEKAAQQYLKKCGYKIQETNFCNTKGRRIGEIDIIARDGDEIVFIEVKTRTVSPNSNYSLPQQNITRSKLYKLNKAANFYLQKNKMLACNYRFDAICLIADINNNSAKLQHIKNVFL